MTMIITKPTKSVGVNTAPAHSTADIVAAIGSRLRAGQPQEARKITHRIQSNLDAGAFVGTSTGGFRAKKTAGIPPKYWSDRKSVV